jgi:predicted permease
METLLRNARYAIRGLARTPGFTITVVLTLALGIGANSAVFSGINAVLLRPLGFPHADRIMLVTETRESAPISNTAPVRIEEWNEGNTTFEAISGYYTEDVSETSGDLPEKFRLARVAPRFFDVWGVAPEIGRGFTPEESQEGAARVVVISHRFWQARLRGEPNVLGRQLRLSDQEFSIVGVMPESFPFPDRDVDLWAPRIYFPWMLSGRNYLWYSGYGRLKPGVSVDEARADLTLVQGRFTAQYPETDRDVGVHVEPLKQTTVGAVRGSLWLLFGSVSVLLLIAATNVAGLLVSRAVERRQEFVVRFALGASRRSVIAQTLTETAVLSVGGAALGLAVAQAGVAGFATSALEFPRVEEIALDGRILLYTLVTIIGVTILCGLLPAIRSVREGSIGMIPDARRTQVSERHSLQWLFVGIQVALSVVLLTGAGLLIRSFFELSRVDPGFEPSGVLSFRISGAYEDFEGLASRVEVILAELRALPGVEAAATSAPVPCVVDDGSGFQFGTAEYEVEGRAATEPRVLSELRVVSPSYFATLQIPVLTGELCRVQPVDAPNQVMVNRAFAARYLAGSRAVERRLRAGNGFEYRVAGVVGDAREYALGREPTPTVYACRTVYANPALAFLVRTRGEPLGLTSAVGAKIKELEPLRAVFDVAPLTERIGEEYAQDRLRTTLLGLFAATALALACLGIYGTLSYIVSLRRREVGLRIALGALSRDIVTQFLVKALRVVGVACAAGLVLALAFTRALSGMLYGVSPFDPVTLSVVIAVVVGAAVLAAILPAARAARTDPMQALREE